MLASITATCHHSCAAPPSRAAEPSLRPIGLTATDVYGDRRPTRQRGAASVRRPATLRTDSSAHVRKVLTLVSRPWRARAAWHRADRRTCSTIWCSSDITRHSAGLICTARASAPHRAIPTCVGRFPLGPKPPCAVLARLAFGRHRSACVRTPVLAGGRGCAVPICHGSHRLWLAEAARANRGPALPAWSTTCTTAQKARQNCPLR